MPLVTVTRMRLRSIRFVPLFLIHAQRAIAQIRKADGHLVGTVKRDGGLAYWTMSVWRDESAMLAYVASGAHRSAMKHLGDWCSEAGMVRWLANDATLPDWTQAARRLAAQGRASRLKHPGPDHAGHAFAPPASLSQMRL